LGISILTFLRKPITGVWGLGHLIYKESQDSYDRVLAHYRNDYFSRYSDDQMNGKRDRLFGKILDLIAKRRDAGRLLDIGTGCGFFLVADQKRGWKVKGIDYGFPDINIYNSPPTEGKRYPEDDAHNV
jgi:2-polyprenyl-3-methyl-5-hydroxy-6-metoxy-1,4-benzoquinol methylase